MAKPRKNERIHCQFFNWRLIRRNGTYYADGRGNVPSQGRHSLDTKDYDEAVRLLPLLDRVRAEACGLAPRAASTATDPPSLLTLANGRQLYEAHQKRPRIAGGVRPSTFKKYKATFDKFLPFAEGRGIACWNAVTADILIHYAGHLEAEGYAPKSLVNELTILKQTSKWLIRSGHLGGPPITLPLRKAQSDRAYCYRQAEVAAMIEHCRSQPSLNWLGEVIIALACGGFRIAELASLRWSDIDFDRGMLSLTDETGRTPRGDVAARTTKSGRDRQFPIHAELDTVLRSLSKSGAYVFRGPRGGRLKPDTVRRIFIREVLEPLASQFPSRPGEKGFADGRLHSFRHYFCSTCANTGVPERMVMDWLGHADSEMTRHYYHLHDEEAHRTMQEVDFLGPAGGRSAGHTEDDSPTEEPPSRPESE